MGEGHRILSKRPYYEGSSNPYSFRYLSSRMAKCEVVFEIVLTSMQIYAEEDQNFLVAQAQSPVFEVTARYLPWV